MTRFEIRRAHFDKPAKPEPVDAHRTRSNRPRHWLDDCDPEHVVTSDGTHRCVRCGRVTEEGQ